MLFSADSSPRMVRVLQRRWRRSRVQLFLSFVETDDSETRLADISQALEPQERAVLVTMLARLMAKAIKPEEDTDE
jgi:hypothetical protein